VLFILNVQFLHYELTQMVSSVIADCPDLPPIFWTILRQWLGLLSVPWLFTVGLK